MHLGQSAQTDTEKSIHKANEEHLAKEEKARELLHNEKVVSSDSQTMPQVEQDKIVPPANVAAEVQQLDALTKSPTSPMKTQPTGAVEEVKQHFHVSPLTEGHTVTVTQEDGMHHKFKAVCTCAWQGLFKTKEEAIERSTFHKAIRTRSPF